MGGSTLEKVPDLYLMAFISASEKVSPSLSVLRPIAQSILYLGILQILIVHSVVIASSI